ncbi:MAG: DNA repair protein RadA [Spirochaetota bacterium]
MAKQKNRVVYKCSSCEHEEAKWMGRCPSCGAWNTFEKTISQQAQSGKTEKKSSSQQLPVSLHTVSSEAQTRFSSGNSELDRVLGGGIMLGSAVLLGGEPGIGKSTLLLQAAAAAEADTVLYVSGEESPVQIRMRAERLELPLENITVLHGTSLEQIRRQLYEIRPNLVIIDSVQTVYSEEIGLVPGTVNQVKYSCMEITDWAKQNQSSVFFIGHVTKDGSIAGPKVVEHMVDTVLNFEQADTGVRIIRASKNRFGSVDEIGVFTMEQKGLFPVPDPATFFLGQRSRNVPPGSIAAAIYEGTRTFMVEIQALAVSAKGGYTRVYSDRIDSARVSRVAAVLEKHLGLPLSEHDLYVNVAGGIRVNEVGVELPLALALYSAVTGRRLQAGLVAFGELSLAGEVRPVRYVEARIKSAEEMGFLEIICPQERPNSEKDGTSPLSERRGSVNVVKCRQIKEATVAAVP